MGFFIDQYRVFKGSVQELVDLATKCSSFLNLPGDVGKINERTVRYYVSEGLVDKPLRIGRDAEYGYQHLMQFLASRYLVGEGYPMAKVAPYISVKSIDELEHFLLNPVKPNLAELLVVSFAKGEDFSRNMPLWPRSGSDNLRSSHDNVDLPASFESKAQRITSQSIDHRCQDEIKKLRVEIYQMRMDFRSTMKDLQMRHAKDHERWLKSIEELTQLVKIQKNN